LSWSRKVKKAPARWPAIGSALLLIAAALTAALSSTTPASAHPVNAADFQQVQLARGAAEVGESMSPPVVADRSVLRTARNGTVRRTDAGGTTTVIGSIPVYAHDGDGLQGIGIDRGPPGADHFDWPRFLAGLAATGYGGAVCIESFTAQNEAIATAASIWRPLAPSQDTLARDGLSYLRTVLRGLENVPLTG